MRRFNVNDIVWLIILLGFVFYLHILLSTGDIKTFIHPRMINTVTASFYGFILLSIFQAAKIFRKGEASKIKLGFIMFLIPLILGFAVNPRGLDEDMAKKKGVVVTQSGRVPLHFEGDGHDHSKISSSAVSIGQGIIELDDSNFLRVVEEFYNNIERYKGRKVTLSGFVYSDEDYKSGEFVAARMMISCCAADAQVIGLMCKYNKEDIPPDKQWVRIEGRIDSANIINSETNKEEIIPIIIVDSIENISKPVRQYIYQ